MSQVLLLDKSGQPDSWVKTNDIARLYSQDKVLWTFGEPNIVLSGGINRVTGKRSKLEIHSVVATNFITKKHGVPPLTNRALFERDRNICLYCGRGFSHKELTRDHVIPKSKGGPDVWSNVVAACKRCNHIKDDRTPEEWGHHLLALPFVPNHAEFLFFNARHKVIADQMEFLSSMHNNIRSIDFLD